MTIKNFADHKYCQAYVRLYNDGSIEMVSYVTVVCEIDAAGWLKVNGLYSATTRKHIGYFLREYAPMLNYYDAKKACLDNMRVNIHTGEYRPADDNDDAEKQHA